MKIQTCLLSLLCAVAFAPAAKAQLTIPGSDGSDGTFFPLETNVVIDLSQAVPGTWNQPSSQPGKGVYDANKWVIVFKYRNIVIPQGYTVTFKNHPSRAPVIWLATNNVNIDGVVDLSGQLLESNGLREPGPGGFRGGANTQVGLLRGAGFGPGGGFDVVANSAYGNARLLPLIGGSGGSGYTGSTPDYIGGSGGGAILIAAGRTITINGLIRANGAAVNTALSYSGSGGGIRVVASQVSGNGSLQALSAANPGRIRVETPSISQSLNINPPTVAVLPSSPVEVVQSDSAPAVRLLSVGGIGSPVEPVAELGNSAPDIISTNSTPVPVLVESRNLPTNSTVTVTFKPKHPSAANAASAVININARYLSGDVGSATWGVTNSLPLGHFMVQIRAVTP